MHNIMRGCPIRPIGMRTDGTYVFNDSSGQTKALTRGELACRDHFVDLFGGDDTWLRHHFPAQLVKDGQCITADYSHRNAMIFMMGACQWADAEYRDAVARDLARMAPLVRKYAGRFGVTGPDHHD